MKPQKTEDRRQNSGDRKGKVGERDILKFGKILEKMVNQCNIAK